MSQEISHFVVSEQCEDQLKLLMTQIVGKTGGTERRVSQHGLMFHAIHGEQVQRLQKESLSIEMRDFLQCRKIDYEKIIKEICNIFEGVFQLLLMIVKMLFKFPLLQHIVQEPMHLDEVLG